MAESILIHAPQELLEGPGGTPMSYWQLVWWRVRRDKVTLTAAAVILCIVLSALLAPYLVRGGLTKSDESCPDCVDALAREVAGTALAKEAAIAPDIQKFYNSFKLL